MKPSTPPSFLSWKNATAFFIVLAVSTGCITAESRYARARQTDSVNGYCSFIQEYPDSTLTLQALIRIDELLMTQRSINARTIVYPTTTTTTSSSNGSTSTSTDTASTTATTQAEYLRQLLQSITSAKTASSSAALSSTLSTDDYNTVKAITASAIKTAQALPSMRIATDTTFTTALPKQPAVVTPSPVMMPSARMPGSR